MAAVIENRIDAVKLLLEKGASIHLLSISGINCIYMAAAAGWTEIVALLLEKGADPNSIARPNTSDESTLLIQASKNGFVAIVEILIAAKVNVDYACACDGLTALAMACERGQVQVVHILLGAGANVFKRLKNGSSPLDLARKHKRVNVIQVLETVIAAIESQRSHVSSPIATDTILTGLNEDQTSKVVEEAPRAEAQPGPQIFGSTELAKL
jgi:ankyrin repeat protein